MTPAPRIGCQEPGCGVPIAEVRGDVLIIRARHHGAAHVTILTRAELLALLVPAHPPDPGCVCGACVAACWGPHGTVTAI